MKIDQDFVPSNLEEAVKHLQQHLEPANREYILKTSDPVRMHFGAGMLLRNTWSLWEDTPLVRDIKKRTGLFGHGDDNSSILLDCLWCAVHGKPWRIDELAKRFREHWIKSGIDPATGERPEPKIERVTVPEWVPVPEDLPPPYMSAARGHAWVLNIAEIDRRSGDPRPHSTVKGWLIHAPWAHPVWHSYALYLIHLRELPGVPPAKVSLPGATHQVFLAALDPEWKLRLDDHPRQLHPLNFTGQFISENDEAAIFKCENVVREIVIGQLSPDTDFIGEWVKRFSGSNLR